MATILIVDDRPTNREFLTTLLGYGGHRLLEAADGAEALAIARADHPDLVISDILMPTMDGYELVRQLRAEPALARTPVIFFTAHYHEQEALTLARDCGVSCVLTKPAEPQTVLGAVEAALGITAPPIPPVTTEDFDREHLRLLTDKVSKEADRLKLANERLSALVDLGLHLGSELDLRRLLQNFGHAAREIIGARYAITAILDNGGPGLLHVLTSGMSPETAARLGSPDPKAEVLRPVLNEGHCLRLQNPGGTATSLGLSSSYPPIQALLAAPIESPTRIYGWLCLIDKIGAEAFSEEDERLARILAAQVGRIYQNGSLYADVLEHAAKLELEVTERKRAEAALRENEEMFRCAFEDTNVAMVLTDLGNSFLRLNAAFAGMFGYSPREMLQMSMADITHPDDLAESYERRKTLLGGASQFFQMEKRYLHKDGHVLWCMTNVALVRDPSGRPRLYVGQVQDITERKKAEAALVGSEARKGAILDSALDGIVTMDKDGLIREFNHAAEKVFGFRRADILGNVLAELIVPPALRAKHRAGLARFLATGESTILGKRIEMIGMRANGTELPIELSITHFHVQGEPMFTGIIRDITQRKQRETALREREEQVRLLLDSTAEGIYGIDLEGNCTLCNRACVRILGYASASDLLGKNMHSLCHYNRPDGTPYPVEQCRIYQAYRLNQGSHVDDEVFWKADSTCFPVEYWSYPMRREGEIVGAVVTFLDITERRNLEEQFRQAQKMEAVGRLAGGVAHDFNNLLTVINGYSEMFLGTLRPEDPLRMPLEQIHKAGERATGLTSQLLAFSRKQVLMPVVLDLNAVLAEMEKMLRRLIGEDIALTFLPGPELWRVKADPGQMEQVVMNVVVNARDAMPLGGKLLLETKNVELDERYAKTHTQTPAGENILLAISDTGSGMDPSVKARIFEPFYTTKGPTRGTGLGLATVFGIVKQSGGHIEVYSEVGQGTTFKIYLPRDRSGETTAPTLRTGQPVRGGTETILLVEDEEGVRTLAKTVLEMQGYTVIEARHGGDALLICETRSQPIDLLVTDVVMPHLSGKQLAERLAVLQPNLKVLYMSGYTDDAIVHHGVLDPGTAFVQKPFAPDALARKVREVLDQ